MKSLLPNILQTSSLFCTHIEYCTMSSLTAPLGAAAAAPALTHLQTSAVMWEGQKVDLGGGGKRSPPANKTVYG